MGRFSRLALVAALLLAATAIAALGYRVLAGAPVGLLLDDGLFYAGIALNLATTGQSTFDGIHTTGGYHLLWEGVLASAAWLVAPWSTDPHVHMRVFLTLSLFAVLLVGTGFARRAHHRLVLITLALSGHLVLETVPLILLLLGITSILRRIDVRAPNRLELLALGALTALVPLTRIDAAPIAPILMVGLVAGRRWRALGVGLAGVTVGVLMQIGLMLALFGEPWSVSSMHRGHALTQYGSPPLVFNLVAYGAGLTARSLLLLTMIGLGIGLAWPNRHRAGNGPLLWLALGLAGFSVAHLLLSHMRYWYFVPGLVGLGYVLIQLDLPQGTARRLRAVALLGLAVLSLAYLGNKTRRMIALADARAATWEFLDQIGDFVPSGEAIYQVDGSGRTGFYSGRPVVNGDGLVNDYRYARRLVDGDLAGYLDEEGICYLITNRAEDGDPVIDQGGLVVPRSGVEELLRSDAIGRTGQVNYTLYRRTIPACGGRPGATDGP